MKFYEGIEFNTLAGCTDLISVWPLFFYFIKFLILNIHFSKKYLEI